MIVLRADVLIKFLINYIYFQTRLEIALGNKVLKLFFFLTKNTEDSRHKKSLNASTTHYLSINIRSVNQIHYDINLGNYKKDSSNTFYILLQEHYLYCTFKFCIDGNFIVN